MMEAFIIQHPFQLAALAAGGVAFLWAASIILAWALGEYFRGGGHD